MLLWRSSLSEPEWADLALALSIRHIWNGAARDLEISFSPATPAPPEPIDPFRHYGYPPSTPDKDKAQWHRPYPGAVFHKMDISGGTNDSAVVHAVEPMFRRLGASIMTFHGSASGHASSIAHDLMHLWLTRLQDPDGSDLAAAYGQLSLVFEARPLWDGQLQAGPVTLVLDFLQRDAARLPAGMVARYLSAAMDLAPQDEITLRLIAEAALQAGPAGTARHEALTQIASAAQAAMRDQGTSTEKP